MKLCGLLLVAVLAGCSSSKTTDAKKSLPDAPAAIATTTSTHPYAKHIEIAGFRLLEGKPGKLQVKFAAINHSPADLGDVTLSIKLTTAGAAPEDPPIATFEGKAMNWGPYEVKDVTADADTKLKVYELPDWQFLRATYDITFPPPEQQ